MKNIFVVGMDEHNYHELNTIENAEDYNFIQLLDLEELQQTEDYDIDGFILNIENTLDRYNGTIDGIIGFWDFPVTLLTALERERYGTIGPSLKSIVKCEHKYWSRIIQGRYIHPHIPDFNAVDPFSDNPFSTVQLSYPFWLKPVMAHSSQLGFKIENREQFDMAIEKLRDGITRYGTPFNSFLNRIKMPEDIEKVDGNWCIAEELISGDQFTLSAYVFNGNIHTYGLIDSTHYKDTKSFFRYRYPSFAPMDLERRIAEIAVNTISRIGLDNSAFNIEFLYDQEKDQLNLLEINPRISQSHSDLYSKVDGVSNHQVLVDIVCGQNPKMPKRQGKHKCASKCHYRVFSDGVVKRVPGKDDIREVQEKFPGTLVQVEAEEGMQLSDLKEQG